MSYIFNISQDISTEIAGSKAFNLWQLNQFDQKIPETFFLSVKALQDFIRYNNLDDKLNELKKIIQTSATLSECEVEANKFRELIVKSDLHKDLLDELKIKLIDNYSDTNIKLAIRSSSVNEDLENYSFAGQYDSILNVSLDINNLGKSIKRVWASQWSKAIIAYTHKHSLQIPEPGMGVIIQKMVNAEIAGVLFSQNPYSFNKSEIIIEYVEGLGEALVSGEKTPVHLVYDRIKTKFKDLTDVDKSYHKVLKELIAIVHNLEQKTGMTLDIEWAYSNRQLFLLQMRSITSGKENAILWTDENVGEVIPDIVTPLTWSILNPVTNNAFKKFLKELNISDYPDEGLFGLFKGKVFFNNTAFHKTLERFYISTYFNAIKARNENKLINIVKLIVLPFKVAWTLFRFIKFSQILPKKIVQHLDMHKHSLESLKHDKSQDEISSYNHIQKLIELHNETMFLHLSGTILAELYYQFFKKICEKWIKEKTNISADQLLTGLNSAESAKSGEALWQLSNYIREKNIPIPFDSKDANTIEKELQKTEAGKAVFKEINDFIDQFGYSALHEFELLYPRWWEDRSYIYSNIGNYLKNDFIDLEAQKKSRIEEHSKRLDNAKNSVFGIKKWIFNFFYKKASFYSSQRENLKQTFIKAHNELKKHLLNIGKSMEASGIINQYMDILFLRNTEIEKLLSGSWDLNEIKLEIDFRSKQRERFVNETHPQRIVQVGETWYPVFNDTETDEEMIRGIACSSGTVEGIARVIISEDQFDNLQDGDILVTKSTNPGWTPLFVTAAGIVTEIGGALSHGAIIAREYGIPMISAVKDITKIISSGDTIRINGDLGTVEIIEKLD